MFPLVHYFVNRKICENTDNLLALGGIFPDLAASAGMDRNAAHTMGKDFYNWCSNNAPEGLSLARGIISHGISPHCVDYYADEYWPGYRKGWCFMQGEPYMEQIAAVTRLPQDLIWWKGHNFVEISYELLTEEKYPGIRQGLVAALEDQDAIQQASSLIAAYSGLDQNNLRAALNNAPNIFAIHELTPLALAEKQNNAFMVRHKVMNADVEGIARLFCRMRDDLRAGYDSFFEQLIKKTGMAMSGYQDTTA